MAALKKLVAADAKFSFGGDDGLDGFMNYWKLRQSPQRSELWPELEKMLKLGGVMESPGSITFPYLFTDWPGTFDVFEYAAITGSRVNLRVAPAANAKVIRQLSYEIVRPVLDPNTDYSRPRTWQQITGYDGKTGYVHTDYLRSSVDYRMNFAKQRNGWMLTFLVAGD